MGLKQFDLLQQIANHFRCSSCVKLNMSLCVLECNIHFHFSSILCYAIYIGKQQQC